MSMFEGLQSFHPPLQSEAELAANALNDETSNRFPSWSSNDAVTLGLSLRKRFRGTVRHAHQGKGAVLAIQTIQGHTLFSCTVGDLGHPTGNSDVSLDAWTTLEGMIAIVRRTGHCSFYVEKGMAALGKTPQQMGMSGEYRALGGAFPVWLENALCCPIAIVALYSGSSLEDHKLVATSVRDYIKKMTTPPSPEGSIQRLGAIPISGMRDSPVPSMRGGDGHSMRESLSMRDGQSLRDSQSIRDAPTLGRESMYDAQTIGESAFDAHSVRQSAYDAQSVRESMLEPHSLRDAQSTYRDDLSVRDTLRDGQSMMRESMRDEASTLRDGQSMRESSRRGGGGGDQSTVRASTRGGGGDQSTVRGSTRDNRSRRDDRSRRDERSRHDGQSTMRDGQSTVHDGQSTIRGGDMQSMRDMPSIRDGASTYRGPESMREQSALWTQGDDESAASYDRTTEY